MAVVLKASCTHVSKRTGISAAANLQKAIAYAVFIKPAAHQLTSNLSYTPTMKHIVSI